jgi:phage shock protein PspC (stress-responsive transcriptional regulator)
MWAFILFCISLIITIFVYIKRNKIYDENENLNNTQIAEYDKLDKIFVIMLLITIGLVGVAAYVLGWFDF